MNSTVVEQIVEHLHRHDFPSGLAQVSSLAMLMVPAAAVQHMESHRTTPVTTPTPTEKKHDKKKHGSKKHHHFKSKKAKKEKVSSH